jgi:hypothetical protein
VITHAIETILCDNPRHKDTAPSARFASAVVGTVRCASDSLLRSARCAFLAAAGCGGSRIRRRAAAQLVAPLRPACISIVAGPVFVGRGGTCPELARELLRKDGAQRLPLRRLTRSMYWSRSNLSRAFARYENRARGVVLGDVAESTNGETKNLLK